MGDQAEYRDVIVIGGGPAGATAATLLAKRGWSVTVFERDTHPRFHIGESLIPMNLPLFEELGVLEQVDQAGMKKEAATFRSPSIKAKASRFPFARASGDSPPYAYQIERSQLDQILFENARAHGAECLEQHTVMSVALANNDSELHGVTVQHPGSDRSKWKCKYLLDASGQQALLAKQEKWRKPITKHSAAAVFSHFKGIPLNKGAASGDIDIYWFDGGWIWFIPLNNEVVSIGAVCSPEILKARSGNLDDFLRQTIGRSYSARKRFSKSEQLIPAQATANYSYSSAKQIGNRFALIGDAHTFIDPVLSSGVYLAMSGAQRIVPIVELGLNDKKHRHKLAANRYEKTMRRAISAFSWFIYRFNTPHMRYLFLNPRNLLGTERAVVSLLAGDIYRDKTIFLRLQFFKVFFYLTRLFSPKNVPGK